MKSDDDYRRELTDQGRVKPDLIETLTGHDLDCVGNIVQVYRTSMQEQNPTAYAIEQERRRRGL